MKSTLISLLIAISALSSLAQSIDEKIGRAMNTSDWFALDSIYNAAPKDSINDFLEVFSRCLLGNRLNRPDVSIPAFQELLNTRSQNLGLDNIVSSAYMFGMDLSRVGLNEAAADMTNSILEATRQYLDSATIDGLSSHANRYKALAAYHPYNIEFAHTEAGSVPFTLVAVGPKEKNAILMHLKDSYINGIEADITFDTGAGVNMMTPEMAEKFGLTPLEGTRISVKGIGHRDGYIAIAHRVNIGDISVRDVPFTVMPMSTGNEEADKYTDSFNIVLGSELMLQLKDLTIDFTNSVITIPVVAPERSSATPNMCFSSSMNLFAKGTILNSPIIMNIDTGDASYGSIGPSFFEKHKDYITAHATLDSVRGAGMGGVIIAQAYKVPGMQVDLGGNVVIPDELTVQISDGAMLANYECNIGLKTLMMYDKVRFNMVDFVLSTQPRVHLSDIPTRHRDISRLNFTYDKGLNTLQALGIVAVGLGRALINPNAPAQPDL